MKSEQNGMEKSARILDAALTEFATAGYEGASTNRIVQTAGISKGLLFHYYGSKPQLYLHVLDDVIARLTPLVLAGYPQDGGDIFERILEGNLRKLAVAQRFPLEYRFLYHTWLQTPAELQKPFQERLEKLQAIPLEEIVGGFDRERLRAGVTEAQAMTLLLCFMEGFTARWINRLQGVDAQEAMSHAEVIRGEAVDFYALLKHAIYTEKEAPLDSGM